MKKLLYIIGFIGAVTLTGGETFILLNLPGGKELFFVGFFTFLWVFVPLLTLDRYKVANSAGLPERLKIISGFVAAVMTGLSGIFKLMHLAGANWLLILGALVFAAGFLPLYFFSMYKQSAS